MNQSACPIIGKWNQRERWTVGGLWAVGGWFLVPLMVALKGSDLFRGCTLNLDLPPCLLASLLWLLCSYLSLDPLLPKA